MHSFDLQHRGAVSGDNEKPLNYFEKYKHSLAAGVGYSPNRKLSFIPYVKALNDQAVTKDTVAFGLWILSSVYH